MSHKDTVRCLLRTLGTFELSVEGRPVPPPPTHKARALVAFVVLNAGRDVSRERLMELLWSEHEPERAREGLRTALSSIRQVLRSAHADADRALMADKSIIRWMAETTFDIRQFEQFAHSGIIGDKRAAVQLYRGDFLEGSHEEWVVRERDRLSGAFESVLADLVTSANDAQAAQMLFARNPFHEDACAVLIDGHLRARRPAAAAALLAEYRAAIAEIGVAPSAEFQRRFASLIHALPVRMAARRRRSSRRALADGTTNLPAQLSAFVGRVAEIAEIESSSRACRLITLVGAGGIGKTRLAIEAAGNLRSEFDGGVWFVDCARITDAQYVLPAIASALNVSDVSARRPLPHAVVAAMRDRNILLVLDNCEHVVSGLVPILVELLQACPRTHVLATSREPLNISGERLVRVAALPEDDAIALFSDRARSVDKNFILNEDSVQIVAAICRRLDGVPLALELAAPRLGVVSLRRLQEMLSSHFNLLASENATSLPHHKTIRTLIDWSYDFLSVKEQALLRYLGVFVGNFTAEAATAVFGETADPDEIFESLSSLVAKSLVVLDADAESERYNLLQITRDYAREKMRDAGEFESALERHAMYFQRASLRADEEHGSANASEWLRRYGPDVTNVRAAIDYYFERGDIHSAAVMIAAARELWLESGLYAEGVRRAEGALQELSQNAPVPIRAGLWLVIALLGNMNPTSQGEDLTVAERAVNAFESLGDERRLIYALHALSLAMLRREAIDEANEVLLRAQVGSERVGNRRVMARVLLRRGYLCMLDAHDQTALRERVLPLYERALRLARAIDDDLYVGYVLAHLAEVHLRLENPTLAVSYGLAARETARRRHQASKEALALNTVAKAYLALGDLTAAETAARTAILKAREDRNTLLTLFAIQYLAAVMAAEKKPEVAARLLGFVDARFAQLDFKSERRDAMTRERAIGEIVKQIPRATLDRLASEGAGLSDDEILMLAESTTL